MIKQQNQHKMHIWMCNCFDKSYFLTINIFFSVAKMKKKGGSYLRRDGQKLSEINLFDVRFGSFIIACATQMLSSSLNPTSLH